MDDWPDFAFKYTPGHFDKYPNEFPHRGNDKAELERKRGRSLDGMFWALKPDEAMVIEMDQHGGFWMLTNMGVFMNSMDFLYRPISYTPSRTKVSSDGKIRFVLSHDDPGYYNWVDTQKFEQGNITYRNFLSDQVATFKTKVVKRDQIAAALPADTPKVTPEERIQQLHDRFNGIQRRYSL
jgi:hypothetical protein